MKKRSKSDVAPETATSRLSRRRRLRSRVLLLTTAFAAILFATTFGLSWRARAAQQRWSRIVGVETQAISRLEDLIRAQNAFRTRFGASQPETAQRYRSVAQLLQDPAFDRIDIHTLRGKVKSFQTMLTSPDLTPPLTQEDIDQSSLRIVADAQQTIDERKRGIADQLEELDRESRDLMSAGLAIAWILVLCSFAAVQATLRKVVKPLEDLSAAADRIAAGDVTARAPVAGDYEIARLGVAFNHMADELKARARTDELTGLPNFRAFRERIDGEIERADRYPGIFGVLVMDLDRFKNYNDTYGHHAGNGALQRVSQVIRETVRVVDFPARYGGEEFAVIAPHIDLPSLVAIAERVRVNIAALPAPADGTTVTVSIGVALYPSDGTTAEALFTAADERLYQAKEKGRNCVIAPGGPLRKLKAES